MLYWYTLLKINEHVFNTEISFFCNKNNYNCKLYYEVIQLKVFVLFICKYRLTAKMPYPQDMNFPSEEELTVNEINLSMAALYAGAHHIGKVCEQQNNVCCHIIYAFKINYIWCYSSITRSVLCNYSIGFRNLSCVKKRWKILENVFRRGKKLLHVLMTFFKRWKKHAGRSLMISLNAYTNQVGIGVLPIKYLVAFVCICHLVKIKTNE